MNSQSKLIMISYSMYSDICNKSSLYIYMYNNVHIILNSCIFVVFKRLEKRAKVIL